MNVNTLFKSVTLFVVFSSLLVIVSCSKSQDFDSSRVEGTFADSSLSNENAPGGAYNPASGEGYNEIEENPWIFTNEENQSTFSIDADGGSYANTRRFLTHQSLPPKDAVRTEEFINYFPMDYAAPMGEHPIALNGEMAECPWTQGHQLLRIGIQGKKILPKDLPATNFVFLIDASGSMGADNKLGLLKDAFIQFTDDLEADDRVAIVTYAGSSAVVLPSTSGAEKSTIKAAIESLGSGGGTAGAEGINTAYEIAESNFIDGGNNRVLLGTDGDFNVGVSSQEELIELIEQKRETGIFLTVLGVGTGNYQDGKMEQLANNGNGTYEYLDNLDQANKVFKEEVGKFHTVAKDVKVQLEFNPNYVKAYRLIGYENRLLSNPDFEDDTKDAGEIGANQSITAIYQIQPTLLASIESPVSVDFRYKKPDADVSEQLSLNVSSTVAAFSNSSENMRIAAALSGFGMLLRDSPYKGTITWENLINWVDNADTYDPYEHRQELKSLIEIAKEL